LARGLFYDFPVTAWDFQFCDKKGRPIKRPLLAKWPVTGLLKASGKGSRTPG